MLAFNPFYLFIGPVDWALEHFSAFFNSVPLLRSVGPFGLSIVAVTLIIRTLLIPVFVWQIKATRRVQEQGALINPQLQKLRAQYKGDPSGLNRAMQEMYAEHGMSPLSQFSGCLPLLVQLPVLYSLFGGIRGAVDALNAQHIQLGFLWIHDVSQSVRDAGFSATGLILPIACAAATFISSKMMLPPARPNMTDQERMMVKVSSTTTTLVPLMILVSATSLMQGLPIYWFTQSCFMIAQQYVMIGTGQLHLPHWVPGADRIGPFAMAHVKEAGTNRIALPPKGGGKPRAAVAGGKPGAVRLTKSTGNGRGPAATGRAAQPPANSARGGPAPGTGTSRGAQRRKGR